MTQREIMLRAHEIARKTEEGHYRVRMSYALRQAWMEAKLIAAGGKLWHKGTMRRIYFNDLHEVYGLATERYNTGNIYKATLDGEKLSNNSARMILSELRFGKCWYDTADRRFYTKGMSENTSTRLLERLAQVA